MAAGECKTVGHLAMNASESGAVFRQRGLTRPKLREARAIPGGKCPAQVNLASILAASRHKCCPRGDLHPARCPNRCGQEDGFNHMLACSGLLTERVKGKEEVDFLVDMEGGHFPPPPESLNIWIQAYGSVTGKWRG